MNIPSLVTSQRAFFRSQKTKDIAYRKLLLKQLKSEIVLREKDLYAALKTDFNKSEFETYISEFGLIISEIDLVLKKLTHWAKPKRVRSSMLTFPSKDYIYKEPYGAVLILAPWNYPFLLSMEPLIMAIASGNTVVLKPSELTVNTSQLISEIISKIFNKEHACVIQGGIPIATELLAQKWDYIFFTGSISVGKIVAKAAAKHLTPVTLELGGKTPCIIDGTMDLALTAQRLVWGKFLNAGQTCISPDYLLVKSDIKDTLIDLLKSEIVKSYGENPEHSPDFPRIINKKNLKRLKEMTLGCNIIFGGEINDDLNYISPTLIDEPDLDSDLMKDEIFGPVLPILTYNSESDLEKILWNFEKPLALYMFSKNKGFIHRVIKKFSFGGGAINDTLIQFGNPNLPFGGIGASGMGAYHGKFGFDTFSHNKTIVKRGTWVDPKIRYAPYKGKLNILKTMFKYFS